LSEDQIHEVQSQLRAGERLTVEDF
jgi:hypothetical protein